MVAADEYVRRKLQWLGGLQQLNAHGKIGRRVDCGVVVDRHPDTTHARAHSLTTTTTHKYSAAHQTHGLIAKKHA